MTAGAVRAVPRVLIDCDGARATGGEAARLLSCQVAQRVGLPDQVEIAFRDGAPAGAATDKSLRVQIDGVAEPLFDGSISGVEHVLAADSSVVVRVRGYDRLHLLQLAGGVKAWADTSVGALARELAGAAGLSVHVGADGPALPRIIQHGQSDLSLLRMLAERAGIGLHLRGDSLELYNLDDGVGDAVVLVWGHNLRAASVDDNPGVGGRPVHVEGDDLTRVVSIHHDTSAADGATRNLVGLTLLGNGEPAALARAEAARQGAQAMTVRGLAEGNPLLRPGAVVRLDPPPGLTQLARRVVLTEVRHTIDDFAGFVSQISSAPPLADPGDYARRGSCDVALATVDRVDDPHGAGRVKLTLDAYGDVETEWLPVLSSGAGAAAGLMAQPDVGDRVLLLSSNSDPGWGVVLGGLYAERLPEEVVQGGRTRRQIWATSGGQRISLDDVANSVTVSDKGGSRLELKSGLVTLLAAGDLEISAPGKAIRITAATVDFLQG